MTSYVRGAVACGVLALSGLSSAQRVDGNWAARVQHGGVEMLYQVDIAQRTGHVYGLWSVETFKSSAGCLIGEPKSGAVHFRTCTTDGSAGTRDMQAVCPAYHRERNRLVPKGGRLSWEVWDERRRIWQTLILLRRAQQKRAIDWSEAECGTFDRVKRASAL